MTYTPPRHVTQHWSLAKPAATSRRGIVVSQSHDAAEAGRAILDAGGNAIDAAVGMALALASAEPWNSGLGGIGFALVHRAGERTADVVDFGPVAPAGLSPSAFRLTGRMTAELFTWPEVEGDANIHGPLSFAIPSAPAGYELMHRRWGRMPLAQVAEPAVALARRGLPKDWFTTVKIASAAATLRRYAESARIYLPDGLPPAPPYSGLPGFLHQGQLAQTLERLAHAGLRDFYEGEVAASLAADIKAMGGLVSADDLRNCQARILPATPVAWRNGRTVQVATGLTAGPTLAHVLDLMRTAPWGKAPDAAWYAALAAAMKTAYAARLAGMGETEPRAAESCTTHLTVRDADGTMVALTTTLLSSMGSRVVVPGTGVLMNNGVMWFDPRPGQPNSIAPGKRPLTNMCPIVVAEDGQPVLAAGASGGRRILASVAQMLAFVADFAMTPEQAAHMPRIDVSGADTVTADGRLAPGIIAALEAQGPVELVEPAVSPVNFANPNLIARQPDGSWMGISDAYSPWSAALAQT
ncbi:MAG: gamma-glutamyltransferase [Rhodospirillales bacterium]|nr:gamma-glutamyltransferase [Rhodospirillales bacterium]